MCVDALSVSVLSIAVCNPMRRFMRRVMRRLADVVSIAAARPGLGSTVIRTCRHSRDRVGTRSRSIPPGISLCIRTRMTGKMCHEFVHRADARRRVVYRR